jgi:hypothetical protein
VGVVEGDPGLAEALDERPGLLVPERQRPLLPVADARVDDVFINPERTLENCP